MNRVKIIQGDITTLLVDVIVNAANSTLLGGGGVDGAIHRAAGPELLAECNTLGGCKTGQAKLTKGYRLSAKYIIHTVGPIYRGGNLSEAKLLRSCYLNSIALADEVGAKSIAFPCISTGVYGYPFREACTTALQAIADGLVKSGLEEIILVCFNSTDFTVYSELFAAYKSQR